MSQQQLIETIATLRLAVGFLGERPQSNWWMSAFFGATGSAFLIPAVPKTVVLAQFHGVCRAAARVHDDRIGVGSVFHLFRLPDDAEQSVHRLLLRPESAQRLSKLVQDHQSALETVKAHARSIPTPAIGPVRMGRAADLSKRDSWRGVAAHYAAAFQTSTEVFPFFSAT
jgi:hypothetical protein